MKVNSLENMNEDITQQHQVFTIFTLTFTNTFLEKISAETRNQCCIREGPMKDGDVLRMDLADYSAIPKTTRAEPSL